MNTKGFCIFIDTFCDGVVVAVREGNRPCVFATRVEAECEIADFTMSKLQEFMDGERDFDDASTIEEFVDEVQVTPDGAVLDMDGRIV